MDENNQILEGKLVQSIAAKELGSLTADCAELGLDALLNDGLAKDIPIVGTLIKAAKVGLNVRDRIYAKKIIGFLVQVGQTTQEQRDEFVKEYCGDVKRFEETVHLILEQAERFEKIKLVGKIFKACILGKITYGVSVRLSEMVNRAFWDELSSLIEGKETIFQKEKLYLAGFYDGDGASYWGDGGKGRTPLNLHSNYYTEAIKLISNEQYDKLESLASPIE